MISIRRIRRGDSPLYQSIRLRALKEDPHAFCATYESALQRTDESWSKQVYDAAEGSSQAIFLAFEADNAVGLAAVYRDDTKVDEAEVFQVWVSSESRGKGVGKAIMNKVIDWCGRAGYARVVATIRNTNLEAFGFYEMYGFEKRSENGEEVTMVKETKTR
ncbi:GNAT family N-acetyltransferase [Puniceicoccaceae bacterium K14]|nr:GNAT family N-acetyltransferase [Puniceicoccaceae bacterium K14]